MKLKTLQILISLLTGIILLSGIANAAQKTIVKEYSYQAGEQDSKASSRVMAMAQIKRLVLEEVGTYIAGTTVVKSLQLESDQINAMTAGIVGLKVIDESWDGKVFYMKAEATFDPDDIAKKLENMARNQDQIVELENTQKKIDDLQAEVEGLKADMLAMQAQGQQRDQTADTSPQNQGQQSDQTADVSPQPATQQAVRQDYVTAYNDDVNQISGLDMVQNGYVNINSGDYYGALDTLNNAIVLSPQVAPTAYIATSIVYVFLDIPQEAFAALNKAVRLNPEIETRATLARAFVYERSGDKEQALEEVNRAMRMDPLEPWAYRVRAGLYSQRGSRGMALADMQKERKLHDILRLRQEFTNSRPATHERSRVITINNSSLNKVEEKPAPGIRSREEAKREQESREKEGFDRSGVGKERPVRPVDEQQHQVRRQQGRQLKMGEAKQQKLKMGETKQPKLRMGEAKQPRLQKLPQGKIQERQRPRQADKGRQGPRADNKQRAQQRESK